MKGNASRPHKPRTLRIAHLQINNVTLRVIRCLLPVAIALLTCLLSGCLEDPTRDHPLDPLGDNFVDEGNAALRVTNFYAPRAGLRDISVSISPAGVSGVTDEEGLFITPSLPGGSYNVIINEPGYALVDTVLQVTSGETTELEVALPGLPTFEKVSLNSVHLSRWFPPPTERFSIEMRAQVNDKDGVLDIDSLWLSIPALDFAEHVFVQVEPGLYFHSVSSELLPVSIESVIGQEVRVIAKDRSGIENKSDPVTIFRVIDDTPIALEPDNLEVQPDSLPVFSWAQIDLAYPFSFQVDVVRINQNVETIVQTIGNIPASQLSVQASIPFPTGDYYWVVSIVDEFGNRSRSREAGFRIE